MFTCGAFRFSSSFECGNLAKVFEVPSTLGCNASHLCSSCQIRQNNKISNSSLSPNSCKTSKVSSDAKSLRTSQHQAQTSPESSSNIDILPDYEFNLFTRPDCAETVFENANRTWFFFSIMGGTPNQRVHLRIMNLNKQTKMFSQGMRPVWAHLKEGEDVSLNQNWNRIPYPTHCWNVEGSAMISWIHRPPQNNLVTYYAFTYPYSYSLLQKHLNLMDTRFIGSGASKNDHSSIYYTREVAIKSLDFHNLDLITISSYVGITNEREEILPGLFKHSKNERPFKFKNKKIVFISSRVHPGETPASFVFNGFMEFILSDDPRAIKLRNTFVFKLVPMLNPDGVINGHYRTDLRGVNLNRVYTKPDYKNHPTIFAARSLLLYYHTGKISYPETDEKNSVPSSSSPKMGTKSPQLPILDENACHSFSEAFSDTKQSDRVAVHHTSMEMDEPSASGWDVSSNISVDSTIHSSKFMFRAPDMPDIHDDCSNISGISEAETGVTSLFGALAYTVQDNNDAMSNSSCSSKCDCKGSGDPYFRCTSNHRKLAKGNSYQGGPATRSSTKLSYLSGHTNSQPLNMSQVLLTEKNLKLHCDSTTLLSPIKHTPHPFSTQIASPSLKFPFSESHKTPTRTEVKPRDSALTPLGKTGIEGNTLINSPDYNITTDDSPNSEKDGVFAYVDLHGHASKRGIFLYGNWFSDVDVMVDNLLLAKVLSMNCANFDFNACNFSQKNMSVKDRKNGLSKEGSGRVAIMRLTGILRSYTLECNYNTGRIVNNVRTLPQELLQSSTRQDGILKSNSCTEVAPQKDKQFEFASKGNKPGLTANEQIPPPFTSAIFEDCGKELAVTLLDIFPKNEVSHNSFSRVASSQYGSVDGVKTWLRRFLTSSAGRATSSQLSPNTLRSPHKVSPKTSTASRKTKMAKKDNKNLNLPTQSPKALRSRSLPRTKKPCKTSSVDTENREPIAGSSKSGCTGTIKSKSLKGKSLSPKKSTTVRSLSFTDIGASGSGSGKIKKRSTEVKVKQGITQNVTLTTNLNIQHSISDTLDKAKVVRKIKKLNKESKNSGGSSKRLKTFPSRSSSELDSVDAKVLESDLPITLMGISPRSPLSCVYQEPVIDQPKAVKSSNSGVHNKRKTKVSRSISKSMDVLPSLIPTDDIDPNCLPMTQSSHDLSRKVIRKKPKLRKKVAPDLSSELQPVITKITDDISANDNSKHPLPNSSSESKFIRKKRKIVGRKSL